MNITEAEVRKWVEHIDKIAEQHYKDAKKEDKDGNYEMGKFERTRGVQCATISAYLKSQLTSKSKPRRKLAYA